MGRSGLVENSLKPWPEAPILLLEEAAKARDGQFMAQHTRFLVTIARLFLLLLVLVPASAMAQIPTGTISGRVTDSQDRSIGAVVITVRSPALQGLQTTTTTANGDYTLRLLPPGVYTLLFEGPGFAAQSQSRTVAATESVRLDVTLQPAGISEALTVVAETPMFTNTVESATNFNQAQIELLPTARNQLSALTLAPAVHQTGPGNTFSINGAMSFESLYMLNGVQIQDNVRGDPFLLYIEDAIQETTVSTSGISAEYGRFSGGVVNTITKSGSNTFSGSFRTSFRNDSWRSVTPFDEPKLDDTVPTYEYTAGGPILTDRTWFFTAGRFENFSRSQQTAYTNIPYAAGEDEKRFEIKGTQALAPGHRLQAAYTGIQNRITNTAQPSVSEVQALESLSNSDQPQSLLAVHYTGTWRTNLFFEAQYSARNFTFSNSGGTSRDRILGTPIMDQTTGAFSWAPLYCAVCGDEERDNDALLLKASYFLSTANQGAHNIVFGYDGFNDRMKVDNHQSASDWHVWTTGSVIEGTTVYPVVEPGESTYIIHWPIAESSQGTNFRTHSFFVNDSWTYNKHFSFNLGLRYDKNAGRDSSNALVANDSMLAPRLGMVWDPRGTGRTSVNVSYGRYTAAVANSVAGSASPAGTPSILGYLYWDGAPINTGPGPYVTADVVLQRVFDWFDASDGFSLFTATIPGLDRQIRESLASPHADEFVVGLSQQIGSRAAVRVDFVNRKYGDFYAVRTDTTTGQVEDEFGQPYDVGLIENTNVLKRQYRALNGQASYRVGTDLIAGMSYTLSRLWGNVNGENSASGPTASGALAYPEYNDPTWFNPEGDLAADQRHRAKIWATYTLPWARSFANMNVGVTQTLESGSPYGAAGAVNSRRHVTNPGYALPPPTQTYYFEDRDAYRTQGQKMTDVAFTMTRRLGSGRAPEVFGNFQVLNLFNQAQLYNYGAVNSTVLTNVDDGSLARFNPFTDTPTEGVHWRKGDKFGQAIGAGAYTQPLRFRFSIGVRF